MTEERCNLKKDPITVVYIAGYGRSGSTLLDLLIGDTANCAGLGELAHFYSDVVSGSIEEEVIGSQRRIFWTKISDKVLSIVENKHLDINNIVYAQRTLENLFGVLLPKSRKHLLKTYQIAHDNLFTCLIKETGCHIFVDSSKSTRATAWRATRLAKLENFRVLVLHLVRDGRGVMLSQLKGDNMKMKKKHHDTRVRFPILKTIIGWNQANLTAVLLRMKLPKGSVHTVYYEDLVQAPEAELNRIGQMIDVDLSKVIQKLSLRTTIFGQYQFRGNRFLQKPTEEIVNNNLKNRGLSLFATSAYWIFCAPMHLFLYGIVRKKHFPLTQHKASRFCATNNEV
jgi:hypothetical protein